MEAIGRSVHANNCDVERDSECFQKGAEDTEPADDDEDEEDEELPGAATDELTPQKKVTLHDASATVLKDAEQTLPSVTSGVKGTLYNQCDEAVEVVGQLKHGDHLTNGGIGSPSWAD